MKSGGSFEADKEKLRTVVILLLFIYRNRKKVKNITEKEQDLAIEVNNKKIVFSVRDRIVYENDGICTTLDLSKKTDYCSQERVFFGLFPRVELIRAKILSKSFNRLYLIANKYAAKSK